MSVDIAIPRYQYGHFLADAVHSILSQSAADLRILIIDNASTDNSLEVARELARSDPRVTVAAHASNLGQHASYNEAIDWATARYFMISDADDILAHGALKRAICLLDAHPNVTFCHGIELDVPFATGERPAEAAGCGDGEWHIESGHALIDRICSQGRNFIGATTVVRRTDVQKLVGHYDRTLERAIDLNMWLRLAAHGDVAQTTAVQAIRRVHRRQLSAYYRANPVADFAALHDNIRHFFRHEGAHLKQAASARRAAAHSIARNAARAGIKKTLKGRFGQGAALLGFAMEAWRA